MQLKISPSKLEQIRLHYTEAYYGTITKEKVIEAIKGETPWMPRMEFGAAFHSVIEHGGDKFFNAETGLYEIPIEGLNDKFVLTQKEVSVAEDYRKQYPNMVNEIAMNNLMLGHVEGYTVLVSLRIDGINGLTIHERKTTKNFPGIEHYRESLQWKIYLLVTGLNSIQYDIFQYNEPKFGDREIKYHKFSFEPYKTIEEDVIKWTKLFVKFCENEGLMDYLIKKEYAI